MTESAVAWLGGIVAGAQAASTPELLAVALGLGYIVLAIRQHRSCWIAGGASTAIYVVVFLEAGLPLQAVLQVFYVVLSVYGWFAWQPGRVQATRPRSWPMFRHLLAMLVVALATAASTPLLAHYTSALAPLADSLGTWASVVATWLLARRVVENWLWWIVVDAGLAGVFAIQGLAFTAALYLAYSALAVVGWRAWRHAGLAVS